MSRPVYTALYSLLIIALFFGASTVYQSCGNSKKEATVEDNLADKVEDVADAYTDESFFEEDEEGGTPPTSSNSEPSADEGSASQSSFNNESTPNNSRREFQEPPSPRKFSGQYMVVAGNYLLENNADIMVKKLRSNGYNNAEKVVFDLSQYYTVVAGSYKSNSIANSISSELSAKGIDNYVLRRKE